MKYSKKTTYIHRCGIYTFITPFKIKNSTGILKKIITNVILHLSVFS